jgi:hypothetical protein
MNATAPPTRRRWGCAKIIGVGSVIVLAIGAGGIWIALYWADKDLRDAIAEADEVDPGWRYTELQARRAAIADGENSARRVLAAHKLLPSPWPPWQEMSATARDALVKGLRELPPTAALTPEQQSALNAAWADATAAVAEARMLKDMPAGRHHSAVGNDGVPLFGPPSGQARSIADLLTYDVLLRLHDKDVEGALDSCRSLVNLARSFGDTPDFVTQTLRMELRSSACRLIERTLAQGRPSPAGLAALQKLLEDEEAEPLFLHGARGMRAWLDETIAAVGDGRITAKEFPGWAASSMAASMRPATLRTGTKLVEAAKLPAHEQAAAIAQALPKPNESPWLARVYIWPKIEKVTSDLSRNQWRTQADLRSTIVALAAERYRQARGAWPNSPAELLPAYLKAVPLDPYDGQPVRWRRVGDGLAIYCVGLDRTDDEGKLDRDGTAPTGTDVGVQMWNRRAADER